MPRKRTRPKGRRRLGDFSPAPWNPREISAEALARRACLMELDPGYCDVIVERWEQFTGRKATRIRPKRGQSKATSRRKGRGKRR